jgi:Tol biopolymer transport system component
MTTTENSMSLETTQTEAKPHLPGGIKFDWTATILCTLLIGGVYLDGWAHAHGKVDSTFFTPWHAVLYSGFAIVGAFLILNLVRNRIKGYPWLDALPPGYSVSLLGVIIFAVGGVLDMIWHILFGIEQSVDALLSPTHLMLALGIVLMVTGPLRAAWLRFPGDKVDGSVKLFPAVLSIALVLSLFAFLTEYAHPQVSTWAARDVHASSNLPGDMYVMNADGSLQTRLISSSYNHVNPAWSHNGRRIAFSAGSNSKGSNLQIYVANADGSGQIRLTNDTFDEWEPAWSPDDRKIIFTSNRDGNYELYLMNADGSGQTRLTDGPAFNGIASWSPDGHKIVFISERDGNDEAYVMNADGSSQTRLTHNNANTWWPSWSPDGSRIAFASTRDGKSEIYTINAKGTNLVQLTGDNEDWNWAPTWSPDGSKIAFGSSRDGNDEVYLMNVDGSHKVNLTNDPGADDGSSGIAWSPDGRKLLYSVQEHPAVNTLFSQEIGIASILLQTVILMGLVLLLVRRWLLPFGSLTLIFTLSSVLISFLGDEYTFILAALAAGLFADLLLWRLKPSVTRLLEFRLFAFVVPLVYYGMYFLVLVLTKGVDWTIHLWMGSIVIAGIIGLLLSYLLIPPLTETNPGVTSER